MSHLVLENGLVFSGVGSENASEIYGEVVFNTCMSGYQEVMTDPSYADQIIVFTNPHLGNTGINLKDHESSKIWAKGVIARDIAFHANHWQADMSLSDFLKQNNTSFLFDVDTRSIVRALVQHGSLWGGVVNGYGAKDEVLEKIQRAKTTVSCNLFQKVSTSNSYDYCSGTADGMHVVVYDFGVKKSILNSLEECGCSITVVPWNTTYQEALSYNPQGIVLSNGPGDPRHCSDLFETVRQFVYNQVPLMGICLGHQLLALSLGAKIVQLKHGHHGSNHPVNLASSDRIFISTQNHNFCISDDDLPASLQVTSRSCFDHSIQAIAHCNHLAFGFQAHPEAAPGPHDLKEFFGKFFNVMRQLEESKCLKTQV